jgi:type II secretory pathway pseudopilin PulG
MKKNSAFTLVEMLMAITIFMIFMGFAMGSYLRFQALQREAALTRTVILELESAMSVMVDAVKQNVVDYDSYSFFNPVSLGSSKVLEGNRLALLDPNSGEQTVFFWDKDAGLLTEQRFTSDGSPKAGFIEALPLHSDLVDASLVSFEIFPTKNPYDSEFVFDDELQFQPHVSIDIEFTSLGRIRDTISLDLHTSVTSRFYQ